VTLAASSGNIPAKVRPFFFLLQAMLIGNYSSIGFPFGLNEKIGYK
jgi:hypothetical protein